MKKSVHLISKYHLLFVSSLFFLRLFEKTLNVGKNIIRVTVNKEKRKMENVIFFFFRNSHIYQEEKSIIHFDLKN